jgi:excinuclease ABC subunit A
LGIWDQIRRVFAAAPEARVRGFEPARFSFNTGRGGQCPTCEGQGAITHEMSFLPDVVSTCPTCAGLRFEPRTLEVRHVLLDLRTVAAEDDAAVVAAVRRSVQPRLLDDHREPVPHRGA